MLYCLINKISQLLKKRKPKFTFGEIDSSNFRTLYKDGKETNLKFYHFEEDDIKNLQKIAQEIHEQNRI